MKKLLLILLCLIFSVSQAQEIGIVGPAANGWPGDSNPTPDIMLTNNGDGTYSIEALTLTTGPAKFREDQAWDTSYGGDVFPSGSITNGDIPVQAGVYDIVLDLNNDTYTFTDVGTFEEITISGSALDSPITLSTIDGDAYEAPVTQFLDGTVVFTTSTGTVYGANSDTPEGNLVENGDAIAVSAGYYEIEFFLANLNYALNVPNVGLVGPGISEWPGDNPTPDVLMSSTDGSVYTLSSQEFFEGEVKFRQNQSWNVNWGGSDFPSGDLVLNSPNNILVTDAGFYDVTFDRENLSYMFTTLSTENPEFNELKVYPNPSKGNWNILSTGEIENVAIYSVTGKLIDSLRTSGQTEIEINASRYTSGMYIIQLTSTTGNNKTLKLIKQ